MPHRIDGRKLGAQAPAAHGPTRNLTVSVLRYERVKTTEAKAKEVRAAVERMITLAKRGDLAARRRSSRSCPTSPSSSTSCSTRSPPSTPIAPPATPASCKIGQRPATRRRSSRSSSSDRTGTQQATERTRTRARTRARVEYDGTDFAGSQYQPGTRTVQGELEAALASLTGGQPDAGRRGRANRRRGPCDRPGDRLHLPRAARGGGARHGRSTRSSRPTSRSGDLRRVPAGFHPRYAARYREYRYTVWNGPRSPLRERFALGVRDPLDTAAMARAGSVLEGRHDFRAFGAADRQPVRTLHRVRVRRDGPLVTIDVRADAFLRRMVRRIAAALLLVGRGEVEESAVAEALASRTPAFNGALAPAKGLCLRRVVLGTAGRGDERRQMTTKTYTLREAEIERRWYVVDATDETLGRLASRIARVLEGKHKPTYTPNLDSGDHVIVLNAGKVTVTRRQADLEGLLPPQRLPGRLQGGDAGSPPRAPPGGGPPPRRQGDAAAQPARRQAAPQAQDLRRPGASPPGPAARAAGLTRSMPR